MLRLLIHWVAVGTGHGSSRGCRAGSIDKLLLLLRCVLASSTASTVARLGRSGHREEGGVEVGVAQGMVWGRSVQAAHASRRIREVVHGAWIRAVGKICDLDYLSDLNTAVVQIEQQLRLITTHTA